MALLFQKISYSFKTTASQLSLVQLCPVNGKNPFASVVIRPNANFLIRKLDSGRKSKSSVLQSQHLVKCQ